MESILGLLTITYDPRKEFYTLRFGPISGTTKSSKHTACLPDGRSCGRFKAKLEDATHFLEKAGIASPVPILAKARVDGGTAVQASITHSQHGALLEG